ncbi:MAG: SPFH domain-containing protein [Deltaproteobacteria bacterium]|nr:SPFH domain-containing protein [Deltaproteobacteria bacterium]
MGLVDGIRRQLRSVVEWEDSAPDLLFEQWTSDGDELKNASRLIVSPGQGCIFVYEGRIRAVLTRPCMIDLRTSNIPFWTTISKFMQAFESEHKVGLFFFRQAMILNQKWGTTSPVRYLDPVYKIPVELKAYGNYSLQITEPRSFFENVVGSRARFLVSDLRAVLTERLVEPLSDSLAEARHSYVEIDAHRSELAEALTERLRADFERLGFALTDFRLEGVDFDEGTKRRIERIADLTAEAQAVGAVGLDYARVQQLEAMREAARNEGVAAGAGVVIGAGIGLGQLMPGALGAGARPSPEEARPLAEDPATQLRTLKELFEAQLITGEEYAQKKQQVLARL